MSDDRASSRRFDYVIVGAGSAGCVLAARLSEDPDVDVLLIEAGPPDTHQNIEMPFGSLELLHGAVDWDYYTGAEPFCDARRIHLPRGRTLGGSSSINAMIYIRGNPLDYDGWRDAGCASWGWEDLEPYFERSLEMLTVAESRWRDPASEAFIQAAVESGYDRSEDFNSGTQDGFGYYQLTQRDGRRCSTAKAYLRPAMARPNLTVETDLLVRQIVLDGTRAVAVEGNRNATGEELRFDCDGEVIVAGGAYNSPQLLMLSGIGPADHLATRLIQPILDRQMVGRNLQDHVQLFPAWSTDRPSVLQSAIAGGSIDGALAAYEADGGGPLTTNGGEAGGFIRTSADLPAPDFQFHTSPLVIGDDPPRGESPDGISLGICLLTPVSTGEVFLAGAEPSVKPIIFHRYFEAEEDLLSVEAAMEVVFELAAAPALAPYCKEPYNLPASRSREDIRAWARRNAQTLYHPIGTCAMGPDEDAVVDLELRVRGVEGLRVVDASVMPVVPRGNTNAPTIALAERASDLIRGRITSPAPASALG